MHIPFVATPVRKPGETAARTAARYAYRAMDLVPAVIPGVSQTARDALAEHVRVTHYNRALTYLTTT